MAQENKKTAMEIAKESIDLAVKQANEALGKKPQDLLAYNKYYDEAQSAINNYTDASAVALYEECAKTDNPAIAVIKAYSYKTFKLKEVKKDDLIIELNLEDREMQIDYLKFCKHLKLDTDWQYSVEKLGKLLCLRTAINLGGKAKDVKDIEKSYFLKDAAKKIEMGGTPTSNTQVCKLIQQCIDEMIPNDDGEGKRIYKCNNYDVYYFDSVYAKKSKKERLTVSVAKNNFLRFMLTDVAYRLITDGKYGVDGYKKIKENA